jgi:hypothetical protein
MLSLGNVFSAEELTAWRAVLDPVTVAGTTIT